MIFLVSLQSFRSFLESSTSIPHGEAAWLGEMDPAVCHPTADPNPRLLLICFHFIMFLAAATFPVVGSSLEAEFLATERPETLVAATSIRTEYLDK